MVDENADGVGVVCVRAHAVENSRRRVSADGLAHREQFPGDIAVTPGHHRRGRDFRDALVEVDRDREPCFAHIRVIHRVVSFSTVDTVRARIQARHEQIVVVPAVEIVGAPQPGKRVVARETDQRVGAGRADQVVVAVGADFLDTEHFVVAELQVLDPGILLDGRLFRVEGGTAADGMVFREILGEGVLLGSGRGEVHQPRIRQFAHQIHAVGEGRILTGEERERVAVAAAGEEVEGDDANGLGRAVDDLAVLHQRDQCVAGHDGHRLDAFAGGGLLTGVRIRLPCLAARIEAELDTAHLREAAGGGAVLGGRDAVLQDFQELFRRQGEEREFVVEPERVLVVQLGNLAGVLSGVRVGPRGKEDGLHRRRSPPRRWAPGCRRRS